MKNVFIASLSVFFFANEFQTACLYGAFIALSFYLMMAVVKLMHRVAPHRGQQFMMVILIAALGLLAEYLISLPSFLGVAVYLLLPVEADGKKIANVGWGTVVLRGMGVFAMLAYLGGSLQVLSTQLVLPALKYPVAALFLIFVAIFAWKNQPGATSVSAEAAKS